MATLDLKALRHFVSVAESLSFARAAERLGTSQPVVTRTVAQLEHNLGAELFERTTRRVALRGRLREGAESYAKDLGQRYSPVRLMCSHPNGETWASRSGAIWVPLAARVLTTSPSFMVFQNMMMAASRFIPAMR